MGELTKDLSGFTGNFNPKISNPGTNSSYHNSYSEHISAKRIVETEFVDLMQKAEDMASDLGCTIGKNVKSVLANSKVMLGDADEWLQTKAIPAALKIGEFIKNTYMQTAAVVGTTIVSLDEGVLKFGEAIVDTLAILDTVSKSQVTLVFDGISYAYSKLTGKEWESQTKKLWNLSKAFIAKEHVSGWFDNFYENTVTGQFLKTNAKVFDFNIHEGLRNAVSGIGYASGVIVLTIFTGGIGGAVSGGSTAVGGTALSSATSIAITAGAAGVGKNAEAAWNKGASTSGGLAAGVIGGVWEGLQYYVGGKINALNLFKNDGGAKTKLLNSFVRVLLDGFDGGVEGFVTPLVDSFYKDGYEDNNENYIKYTNGDNFIKRYIENFDDNGGWNTVLTGALSGAATSALSEALNLGKYFKDGRVEDKTTNALNDFKDNKISLDELKNSIGKINSKKLETILMATDDASILNELLQATDSSSLKKVYTNLFKENTELLSKNIDLLDSNNLGRVLSSLDDDLALKLIDGLDDETWKSTIGFIDKNKLRTLLDNGTLRGFESNIKAGLAGGSEITASANDLLKLINNDELFDALTSGDNTSNKVFSNISKQECALLLENLDTKLKNSGYQNALSDTEVYRLTRISELFQDSSWFNNLKTSLSLTEALGETIETSDGFKCYTSDFLEYVSQNAGEAVSKNFQFFDNVSNKDIANISQELVSRLEYLQNRGFDVEIPANIDNLKYLASNADKLSSISLTDFANTELIDEFRKAFLGYGGVNEERLKKLLNTVTFQSYKEFINYAKEHHPGAEKAAGYNVFGEHHSFVNMFYSEYLRLNTVHEQIHELSKFDIETYTNGTAARKIGLKYCFFDGANWEFSQSGLNEAVTELFAENLEGGINGYYKGVRGLKNLLDLGIPGFDYATLKNAYFSSDWDHYIKLKDAIDNVGGSGYFDKLLTALDSATTASNTDDTALQYLISDLTTKLYFKK